MRVFLAIELDAPIRTRLTEWIRGLQEIKPDVTWVREGQRHLTLKFFGDISSQTIEAVQGPLKVVAEATSPISMEVKGLGQFPLEGPPRILWVGIERGAEALTSLATQIDRTLSHVGVTGEGKPFTPHITIGRVKSLRKWAIAGPMWKALGRRSAGSLRAAEMVLMESRLSREGPDYRRIASFPFKGAA